MSKTTLREIIELMGTHPVFYSDYTFWPDERAIERSYFHVREGNVYEWMRRPKSWELKNDFKNADDFWNQTYWSFPKAYEGSLIEFELEFGEQM